MKFKKNISPARKPRSTGRQIKPPKHEKTHLSGKLITAIKSFLGRFPAGIQILIAISLVCAIAFAAMKLRPEPIDMEADCQKYCHPRFSHLVPIFPEVMRHGARSRNVDLKKCECY